MTADILNHQPAGPSTILPGTWLIDLPQNSSIHVRRYRLSAITEGDGSSSDRDDPLEQAWRGVNTSSSPGSGVRNVLRDPCAAICAEGDLGEMKDVRGRELWIFSVRNADDLEDVFEGSLAGLEGLESRFRPQFCTLLDCI